MKGHLRDPSVKGHHVYMSGALGTSFYVLVRQLNQGFYAVSFVAGGGMRIYLTTLLKQQQQWIRLCGVQLTKEQIEDSS